MGRFLVTGASGFIGSLLLDSLPADKHQVTAVVRNGGMDRTGGFDVINADVTDNEKMASITGEFDYIFHCAAVTQSARMISHPTKVADGIVLGTRNILELALRCHVKSMVYLSSMEVYGQMPDDGRTVTEDRLGNIDILSTRSCYSLGKRMAEHYCYDYYREFGVPVKIARLAQTFGKGVHPTDNRVFMQFARAVLEKKDIVLKTEGLSMGNYCESVDAIRGLMTILYKGKNGEAYNIVNENNTMCIREMAELVAGKISHGQSKVVYGYQDAEACGYAPDTALRLSSAKLQKLGWKPCGSMEQMYLDVIRELKQNR